MANYLRVTPEQVKETSTAFDTKGQEITKLAASANEIVQTLSGRIWSGEAATQYTSRFNTLYNDVAAVQQLITRMVQQLNTIATEYETTETANTEQAGSLPGSVF